MSTGSRIEEGAVSGPTTNANAAAQTLNCGLSQRTVIAVQNTGAADLAVTISTKQTVQGSIETIEVDTAVLTPGSTLRYVETKLVAQIITYVKSNIADTPTSYRIESLTSRA